MAANNTCVAIYPAQPQLMAALEGLRRTEHDLAQVSVLGQAAANEEHSAGFFRTTRGPAYSGPHAGFWQPLAELLGTAALVTLPERIPLAVVGHIVVVMVDSVPGSEIGGGFTLHGAAMHAMGIPRNSIVEYEQALHAARYLLLVHGGRADVERACAVLHSEQQQVIVHIG